MEHSITARYASRPAARFVRASGRARERRLGLRSFGSFQPAPARPTVLRRSNPGPLISMRARWRAIAPAGSGHARVGAPRPAVAMHWTDVRGAGSDRRAGAAPAPWRG